jgi:cytochrome P450
MGDRIESRKVSLELAHEIQQFYFREARLLDDRQYQQWLSLLAEDVVYRVESRHTPFLDASKRETEALLDVSQEVSSGMEPPLRDDNFIEEVVRLETPFKFHYRFVNHDTELCGTPLKAGDVLLLGWASANRDAAIWDDADILKLDRERPERHFGFGYGIHFCIGAPLARLEVRVALEELLAGTQRLELDPDQPYAFAHSVFVRRMQHLHLGVA